MVLHQLEEGVDRLAAEIGPVMGGRETVGLIDEQDAVEGGLDSRAGLDGGLADVAGDEQGTVDLDDMAGAEEAEATRISPMSRAAVVFPVPGLPRKTKWRLGLSVLAPMAATLALGLAGRRRVSRPRP